MQYTLTYRQGHLLQSEQFASRLAAIGRAFVLLEETVCRDLAISENGRIVLREEQIVAKCEEARMAMALEWMVVPQRGRTLH